MRTFTSITRMQRMLLNWMFKKLVIQGFEHKANITEIYKMLYDAAAKEFTEDNVPTLVSFMTECHQAAIPRRHKIHIEDNVSFVHGKDINNV